MTNITLMNKSQNYEVMDLWLRTTTHENPFVEPNFWETHYDLFKKKYINKNDTFICTEEGKIIGFACVTPDNKLAGLFVAPECQNRGVGTEIVEFLQEEYSLLHIEVYAKNRKALSFAAQMGFIIDGAIRHELNNEVMYTMMWSE